MDWSKTRHLLPQMEMDNVFKEFPTARTFLIRLGHEIQSYGLSFVTRPMEFEAKLTGKSALRSEALSARVAWLLRRCPDGYTNKTTILIICYRDHIQVQLNWPSLNNTSHSNSVRSHDNGNVNQHLPWISFLNTYPQMP